MSAVVGVWGWRYAGRGRLWSVGRELVYGTCAQWFARFATFFADCEMEDVQVVVVVEDAGRLWRVLVYGTFAQRFATFSRRS